MAVIDDVKQLLGEIEGKDELLDTIIAMTESRLKALLGVENVPLELEYIVTNISVSRFNRIGSEGVSSHSVGGESMNFNTNDFDEYENDITAWKENHAETNIGKVKFL